MTTHAASSSISSSVSTSSPTSTTTPPSDAFEHIVATQLADTLRKSTAQTASRQPLIIDVRGDDYSAGHIARAVHHPEPTFHDDALVDALVRQYAHEETIVFHCQLSQVRGPFCARRFLARRDVLLGDADKKPAVQVLTGGYGGFSEQFEGDTELLETTSEEHK